MKHRQYKTPYTVCLLCVLLNLSGMLMALTPQSKEAALTTQHEGRVQHLSIEDSIALAKQSYPLQENKKLLEEAQALTLQTIYFHFIPHIRFQSKISYQSDVTTLPFSQNIIQNFGINYTPLSKDQYYFTLEVSQPIVDMMTLSKRGVVEAQFATQKASLESDLQRVSQSVINVYFSLMLLQESSKQNALLIQELEKNAKTLNVLYQQGMIDKDSLNKITIEIIQAKKMGNALQSQIQSMLFTLSKLTNTEVTPDALILPSLDESKQLLATLQNNRAIMNGKHQSIDSQDSQRNGNERGALNTLFANRAEIAYFSAKHTEIATQKKLENAKLMPYVDAFLQGGYSNPSLNMLKGGFAPYYIVGVRMSWDISSIYTRKQQYELIYNQQLQLDSRRDEFLLQSTIALNEQMNKAANLLLQIEENEKILSLREQILRTSEAKLKNGTISINDLITDINNAAMARLQRHYTQLEFLAQMYAIRHTLNMW